MANEFICSDCKGDGTRCDCHKKRRYSYQPTMEELTKKRIEDNEIEIARNLRLLRSMRDNSAKSMNEETNNQEWENELF